MQKGQWLVLGIASLLIGKENLVMLQYTGVRVTLEHNKTLQVERVEDPACFDIAITPDNIFGKKIEAISSKCIKKVLTSLGTVQPMQIDPQVKTMGEIEVLSFLKKQEQDPSKYILVDSRQAQWYRQLTIPTAVNVPYNEITYDADFPKEHKRLLHLFQIQKTDKGYDFGQAKHLLLFCNGAWCVQSPKAIRELINMGYPKEKLYWYRGGLQDWLSMGFRGVKP